MTLILLKVWLKIVILTSNDIMMSVLCAWGNLREKPLCTFINYLFSFRSLPGLPRRAKEGIQVPSLQEIVLLDLFRWMDKTGRDLSPLSWWCWLHHPSDRLEPWWCMLMALYVVASLQLFAFPTIRNFQGRFLPLKRELLVGNRFCTFLNTLMQFDNH